MLKKKSILLLVCFYLYDTVAIADNKTYAHNAVASAHPLATRAGMQILAQGGNAFDAAVAISAALAVVEPYSSGLGGGGFWLLHCAKTNQTIVIDGRETAPLAARRDMYLDKTGKYIPKSSVDGALAAGIPGTVAALDYINTHYGRLALAQNLQPAIKLAQQGVAVTPYLQKMLRFRLSLLRSFPDSAAVFLSRGKIPPLGYTIIQSDLANTLKQIAQHGKAGFYSGQIATKLVQAVQQAGGIWSLEDLSKYQVKLRQPILFHYKNLRIFSAPPPSSGGLVLNLIFNILAQQPTLPKKTTDRVHLLVEAMRHAYHLRALYLGDSDFVSIPERKFRSEDFAAGLYQTIHPDKATPSNLLPPVTIKTQEGHDTTHFVVQDQWGNSVSATMSINYPFGSGLIAAGTGVLLNDEMDDFSVKPGTPNVYGLVGAKANEIAPSKRPLSSMSPSYIEIYHTNQQKKLKGVALLGTPGGSRIISMVMLGILDLIPHTNPQHWVDLPRFHHQYLPDVIQFEVDTFTPAVQQRLKQMGYSLQPLNDSYGNMQAIYFDRETGTLKAASDKRGEGKAQVR